MAKRLHLFSVIDLTGFLMLSDTATAQSQSSSDKAVIEIRRLEAEQVEYLFSGNVEEIKKSRALNFTVNDPFNVVQDAATGPIQTGDLTYSNFERNIEKVLHHDSVIIVMGNEVVVTKTAPRGSSHETDQYLTRRFTNVWMLKDSKWLMIARHANPVCP